MRNRKSRNLENLRIEAIAAHGFGLARHEGKVIFVEKTIPGDVVHVRLTTNKKDYAEGYPLAFVEKSALRTEAFCTHFGVCGGCTWQEVPYSLQLEFKHRLVSDALRRIGKLTELPPIQPVWEAPFDKYYRNKLEYTFSHQRWLTGAEMDADHADMHLPGLGFHIPGRYDKILNIDYCYLQPAPSNEIRLALRAYGILNNLPFYNLKTHQGYLRNLLIRNTSQGDLMVIVSVAEDRPPTLQAMLRHLQTTFPEITSLYYTVNTKKNDALYDLDLQHFGGLPYITEKIGNIAYRLGPKSFFQTNTAQAEHLYRIALEMAMLQPNDVVYDLYTGLGSIALQAAAHCKRVIGIETIEAAVQDARLNAALNGIENVSFVAGDMMKVFTQQFIDTHGPANVVITDPPRAGMHPDVCKTLLQLSPRTLVYVSCNPVTQARDLQMLSDKYEITHIQPVDMFPQTYHIENVVSLNLKA